MKCKKCKGKIEYGFKYCPYCGIDLKSEKRIKHHGGGGWGADTYHFVPIEVEDE